MPITGVDRNLAGIWAVTEPLSLLAYIDGRFLPTNQSWVERINIPLPGQFVDLVCQHEAQGTHIIKDVRDDTTITWGLIQHLIRRFKSSIRKQIALGAVEVKLDRRRGRPFKQYRRGACCLGGVPLLSELPAYNLVVRDLLGGTSGQSVSVRLDIFKDKIRTVKRRFNDSRSFDCDCYSSDIVMLLHPVSLELVNLMVWITYIVDIVVAPMRLFYYDICNIPHTLSSQAGVRDPVLLNKIMFASYILARHAYARGAIKLSIGDIHGRGYERLPESEAYISHSESSVGMPREEVGELVATRSLAWLNGNLGDYKTTFGLHDRNARHIIAGGALW